MVNLPFWFECLVYTFIVFCVTFGLHVVIGWPAYILAMVAVFCVICLLGAGAR